MREATKTDCDAIQTGEHFEGSNCGDGERY